MCVVYFERMLNVSHRDTMKSMVEENYGGLGNLPRKLGLRGYIGPRY